MGRLGSWFARTFGAAPQDAGPEAMEVVFDGAPGECQMVALRLKDAGFFVQPDPSPKYSGVTNGIAGQQFGRRGLGVTSHTVSVLAADAAEARALLDGVEPI